MVFIVLNDPMVLIIQARQKERLIRKKKQKRINKENSPLCHLVLDKMKK